jgi:TatD DNase family protein
LLSDAHCHPFDLRSFLPPGLAGTEYQGIPCAASAWNREQFEYHQALALDARKEAPVLRCFALHPQLPSSPRWKRERGKELLRLLDELAREGRVEAVGEAGFDLYNQDFRQTEALQDEIFAAHLETALAYGLPMVLHVRRAMHKIFAHTPSLKKLPALIFHSWPGSRGEASALLRRGINAFFSFGNVILKNHRQAAECAAFLPEERLLLETDAPYQPPRGKAFSSPADLEILCEGLAELRRGADSPASSPAEIEALTERNFRRAFGLT